VDAGSDSCFGFLLLIRCEENSTAFGVDGDSVVAILLSDGRGTNPCKLYIAGRKFLGSNNFGICLYLVLLSAFIVPIISRDRKLFVLECRGI
jgi:hypothetical protein